MKEASNDPSSEKYRRVFAAQRGRAKRRLERERESVHTREERASERASAREREKERERAGVPSERRIFDRLERVDFFCDQRVVPRRVFDPQEAAGGDDPRQHLRGQQPVVRGRALVPSID